jgi:tripartite-type tricarboxylate transporter receptor subunit TctC
MVYGSTLMCSLVAALLAVGISAASAQTPAAAYPAESLRFMIGFGPGGSTDLL